MHTEHVVRVCERTSEQPWSGLKAECVCACVYACMHVNICTSAHRQTHTYVQAYNVWINSYTRCTYVRTHVRTHTRTQTHKHTYTGLQDEGAPGRHTIVRKGGHLPRTRTLLQRPTSAASFMPVPSSFIIVAQHCQCSTCHMTISHRM